MATDAEFVLDFKRGREAAFTELVKRHMERAVQRAYWAVGNYEDAKDVSQEAFVKAHRALKSFEMRAEFSTWFHRILMNQVKDFLRKRAWKRFLRWETNEAMDNFFEGVADPAASPVREMAGGELTEEIARAIHTLPFKQQWVFNLRFLEGLSLREIGEATGMAQGTVKANLHFSIQKFKQAISPHLAERRG